MSLQELLTAEQAQAIVQADGVAYLNVGCVPVCQRHDACKCLRYNGLPHCKLGCGYDTALAVALFRWVELAEATCETCGGVGCDSDDCQDDRCDRWHDCLDCHEGKPIHTISVPCKNPNCDEGIVWGIHGNVSNPECEWCDGSGTVEVKVIVRELLPVIDGSPSLADGIAVIERVPS